MDTVSAAGAARSLETSIPRVKRAIGRLGLAVEHGPGGRVGIAGRDLRRLSEHLGVVPTVPTLTRIETQVLAALSRAPRGLASTRAVADRAGVSPTAASRALSALTQRGIVMRAPELVAAGRTVTVAPFRIDHASPEYARLARPLAAVVLPRRGRGRRAKRVPPRLRHLFWNTAPAQLDTADAGPYIARRLLDTADPEGLGWGVANLASGDWTAAARGRGLDPATRRMALNFARHAPT